MKIVTSQYEYNELTLLDVSKIEKISRDMAWNDTINLLLDKDKNVVTNFPEKKELFKFQDMVKSFANRLKEQGIERKNYYAYIPQNMIPQECWHFNFSMLKPDFRQSALQFVNQALQKRKEADREGFWLSIKDKKSGKMIGATMISSKVLFVNGMPLIGHSGQFIHPEFQKKGVVTDTKAVMVDFMYKYLIDKQKKSLPGNAVFYTTCHVLNTGSRMLQKKSGAICQNPEDFSDGQLHFYASRDSIMNSRLMLNHNISWGAEFDNGTRFSSSTNPGLALRVWVKENNTPNVRT